MTASHRLRPPEIAVTVDAVAFTVRNGQEMVALVQRGNDPFRGAWALPGGFVETEEDLADAAARELVEETGLEVPAASLRQLGAYGAPGRDPRMRTVSVVYWARIPDPGDPVGGSDAAASSWITVEEALEENFFLAFDHRRILTDAVEASRR
ncbi:MAG: NUDIX domain-containing protein [Actinomycetota bacterium]